MATIRNTLAKTFIIVVSTIMAFAIAETLANTYLLYIADQTKFVRYASIRQIQDRQLSHKQKHIPHRYIGYYPAPNYSQGKNKHNSLGYRGDEIDMPKKKGRFRIVCLGGSTTYTTRVDDYQMSYPYLLEKYLKGRGFEYVECINSGAGGWSSWESLINFELRVLDLQPDMIIIYHGINDIHPRFVWPPSAYRGDNSGRRTPNNIGVFMPRIIEYSTVLRTIMINVGATESHADIERTVGRSSETYYGSLFRTQKAQGVYPTGFFKDISAQDMLNTNKPVYFERNIRNIISIAKTHDTHVLLSSFAYSSLFIDQPRVSSQEYMATLAEHNRILSDLARETGVQFFDFASAFPTHRDYYVDGRHVTEKGSQLKAELFGNYLIENKLIAF